MKRLNKLNPSDAVVIFWLFGIAAILILGYLAERYSESSDRKAWCQVESPGPCTEIEGRGTCKLVEGTLYMCWEGK